MTRFNKEGRINQHEIDDPHVEFNGKLFSIGLVRRDDNYGDWMVQLYTEDDGNKFLVCEFDADWFWDLKDQLHKAEKFILDSKGLHE